MFNIMFSLLVHEEPYVIYDQLINLFKYNENCAVVIHLNPKFDTENFGVEEEDFLSALKKFDNVYVNVERLPVGKDDIIQAHLSNFEYVKDVGYKYFYFIASNELFLKSGLYEHIKPYDYGCELIKKDDWHYYGLMMQDKSLKDIIAHCNGKGYFYSQVEGTFYDKTLFKEIAGIINKYYDYKHQEQVYPRDEVYFSTVAGNLFGDKTRLGKCCCKIRWQGKILFTSVGCVKRIVKKDTGYYSVKRVDRKINNYLRNYIRTRVGKYNKEVEKFTGLSLKKTNLLSVYAINNYYLFVYGIRNILAKCYRFIFRKK